MKNYSILKKNLFTLILLLTNICAFAQKASLQGKIYDASSQMTVSGASIFLKGTKIGTASNSTGNFKINNLPTGKEIILVVSFTGYEKKEITVTLKTGETKTLPIFITETEGGQVLQGVSVQSSRNKESEAALNMERKNETISIQKIGAVELSRKGASSVSDGVSKISGVALSATHNIFIRGLGDRYNNVTLNGLPVPSTNPDQKMIPLEIFPTSLIQNIAVVKSYTSPYYGDVSGGTIDITTKQYPNEPFIKVSVSSGINSITTGLPFLATANQNFAYKLGYGNDQRQAPLMVDNPNYDSRVSGNPNYRNLWSPAQINAPLNYGFNISAGALKKYASGKQFGYILSLSQKQDLSNRTGATGLFNAQKTPQYLYSTQNYIQNNNTSALLSLYYRPNDATNITLTSLFVNDANNDIYNGNGSDNDLGNVYYRRNTYTQNTLITNQLKLNHNFNNYKKLNVSLGYSKTFGNMPDRVQNGFYQDNGVYTFLFQSPSDNQRYSYHLDDNELVGNLGFESSNKNEKSIFKKYQVGINARYKFRAFHANVVTAKLNGLNRSSININKVDTYLDGKIGNGENNTWYYENSFNASNDYEANLGILAPFVNLVFNWHQKWNLVAGVRAEISNQKTFYHLSSDPSDAYYRLNEIPKIDILPGATLKRILNQKSNILLAISRSMSRPLFVEAAPFRLNSSAGTAETEGNPNIKNSSIVNADLKYEIYPSSNELFAISLFGKYLVNPIERMQLASSDPIFSFVNTQNAVIAGIEIELNRNIGKLFNNDSKVLNNLNFGLNATYMYNKIQLNPSEISQQSGKPVAPTNVTRPLFGASPYLINFDMSYKNDWNEKTSSLFTITYNVFGKRLFVAGSQGAGDIYEMPVNSLNFIINNTFAKKYDVNLSIMNILNPNINYQQEFKDANLLYNSYKQGVNVNLTLGYKF